MHFEIVENLDAWKLLAANKIIFELVPGTLHEASSSSSLVAMLLLRSPVVVPYWEREEEALMQMLQAPHHYNISTGIFFPSFLENSKENFKA
jgi:hypothetical protein